ncbi:MAG TPA: lasso peptide biosynthesis B2 protein [Thermoanaerobaculia bacterium]|nr:lasso peptide biosynthesis B2 protein [Thermoanaerobaculia bacterium]
MLPLENKHWDKAGLRVGVGSTLSGVVDHARGLAVVLDEKTGLYIRISEAMWNILDVLGNLDHPVAVSEFVREVGDNVPESEIVRLLAELLEAKLVMLYEGGLVGEDEVEPSAQASGLKHLVGGRVRRTILQRRGCRRQPLCLLVMSLAFLNWWYRIRLRWQGWSPVWEARRGCHESMIDQNRERAILMKVVEELLGAWRLASVLPWIKRDCVPVALTMHQMMHLLGLPAVLKIGAEVVPFEPHMWVEVNGIRLEAAVDQQALKVFGRVGRRAVASVE